MNRELRRPNISRKYTFYRSKYGTAGFRAMTREEEAAIYRQREAARKADYEAKQQEVRTLETQVLTERRAAQMDMVNILGGAITTVAFATAFGKPELSHPEYIATLQETAASYLPIAGVALVIITAVNSTLRGIRSGSTSGYQEELDSARRNLRA